MMICFVKFVVIGSCVIMIIVVLNDLFIFFKCCNKLFVFFELSVFVGLFVNMICGLWINVFVVVVFCCWLLDNLLGYLFFRL